MTNKPTYEELEQRVKELELSEKVLRKSEEILRLVIENSSDGIAIVQDDKYIFCNQKMEEMSGYSKEELMTLSIPETLHPDHRQIFVERSQRLRCRPMSRILMFKSSTGGISVKSRVII